MTDYAIRMLQDRVSRKDKLAREMTHEPFVSPYHGVPENFALGVYEAPGLMMEGFDWLADYSTPGYIADMVAPTETTSAGVVNDLMSLGEIEQAYQDLGPYGATPTLQAMARISGQMIDPLAVGGIAVNAGKAARHIPDVLAELGEMAATTPMARQRGALDFGIEDLVETPDVPQTPLERVSPPKGKPKTLKGLLGTRTEKRMTEFAKRGDEEGAGRAWYNLDPLRNQFIEELGVVKGDEQFKRYTDFLAATSPREKVKQNVKRASLFHLLERQGEPFAHLRNPGKVGDPSQEIPVGYGSLGHETQRHLLKDLEGGGHFSGLARPKVSSFAENLAGNQAPMTIDTHNISALTSGKWKRSPTPGEYGYIEKYEADIADKLGMTPAQFQASVWVGAGDETGVADVRPFLDVFNSVVRETALKRNITPAEALSQFIKGEKPLLGLAAALSSATILGEEDENDDRS